MSSCDALLQQLKDNLNEKSNKMKQVADFKRQNVDYHVGDLFFLKLHPYRKQTVFRRSYKILASRFNGRYQFKLKIWKGGL